MLMNTKKTKINLKKKYIMCLITTQKTALIADEDITVFKVLTQNQGSI